MSIALVSFGDDAPSGENLEYDPVFVELMLAAQPGEERQAGDEILAAEEPDYRLIVEKATDIIGRSHDLRAAILLGFAELKLNGLPGLAQVLSYIHGCLTEFWDTCHPQLDSEDDNDPTMRVNSVLGLADPETVLRALRTAPLSASRQLGQFSMRDIEIAEGEVDPPEDMESRPSTAEVSAAFRDTDPDELKDLLEAARAIHDDLLAINAVFNEQVPGQGPDLDPIVRIAKRIFERLSSEVGESVPSDDTAASEEPTATGATGARGRVASAADVVRTLEQIIDYYRANEPSSPLPLLLERAKRLVGAEFVAIVEELAPSGTNEAKSVGGIVSTPEEY